MEGEIHTLKKPDHLAGHRGHMADGDGGGSVPQGSWDLKESPLDEETNRSVVFAGGALHVGWRVQEKSPLEF